MTYREALADFTFLRAFRVAGNRPDRTLPPCWFAATLEDLGRMAGVAVDRREVTERIGQGPAVAYLTDATGLVVAVAEGASRDEYADWLDWLMGISTVALVGEGGPR